VLNSWCSDIGKAGYKAIVKLWNGKPERFGTPEDCVEYVSDALSRMRYVYKNPDVPIRLDLFFTTGTLHTH
jgi:hypothetical protein